MASLSKKEYKLIETLINLKQNDTKAAMSEYLKCCYDTVVETDTYIYATGDIPIALCAHMDTVWEKHVGGKKHLYYDKQKECLWCPEGAGFDDKVGVFLILKILESGLRPHVILTTGEEIGGVGAGDLAKLECPFTDLRYCIELDRRGSNDCVFYSCGNFDFEEYVESFGFKTDWGTFTDICHFCPSWGMAGVNLSVGYVDEHTEVERLYVRPMLKTLSKVKKMLNAREIPFFQYISVVSTSNYTKYFSNKLKDDYYPTEFDDDYFYGYGVYDWRNYYTSYKKCHLCGKSVDEDMTLPLILKDGSLGYVCNDCLDNDNIAWCDYCHEAYECEPGAIEYVCPNCKELIYGGTDKRTIVYPQKTN